MALLTVFLLAEKVAPPAWHISRVSGAVLIAWGVWIGAGIWL
jgi:predicted metal-binding membrane protein